MNKKNHFQFELFPSSSEKSSKSGHAGGLDKDLTLSMENIIVLCIVFVMVMVLAFSFGVDRGKKAGSFDKVPGAKIAQPIENNQLKREVKQPAVVKETVVLESETLPETEKTVVQERPNEEILEIPNLEEKIKEKAYTVQVASFKRETNARKEAEKLEKFNAEVFVLPKGSYSIVCIGKFSDRTDAREFSNKLKNRYTDLLVRRF